METPVAFLRLPAKTSAFMRVRFCEHGADEWCHDYWQLDQAVMDAEMQNRPADQIARLERIRDTYCLCGGDAQ